MHDEALGALEAVGCPVCRRGAEADGRFAFRFSTELYTHPHIVEQVTAARGFCPAHTRLLMARREARYVLRYVHAEVVADAARHLEEGRHERPAICYACRNRTENEEGLIRVVLAELAGEDVAQAYHASGGFCYPHLVRAFQHASPHEAGIMVEVFREAIAETDVTDAVFQLVAGQDADAPTRHSLSGCLPCWPGRGETREETPSTSKQLLTRLELDACPSCLAGGLAERRYLHWLAEQHRLDPDRLSAEIPWLCGSHLHDLALHSPQAARWGASLARATVADRFTRLGARLAELPAATLVNRLVGSRRAAWRQALRPFAQPPFCGACHAGMTAEERESALLVAALADAPTERRYQAAHGLCLRHLDALPAADRDIPRRAALARVRVLHWELEEAGRKATWQYRYEPMTAEAGAWYRAAGLLDGRTFLGGTARDLSLGDL